MAMPPVWNTLNTRLILMTPVYLGVYKTSNQRCCTVLTDLAMCLNRNHRAGGPAESSSAFTPVSTLPRPGQAYGFTGNNANGKTQRSPLKWLSKPWREPDVRVRNITRRSLGGGNDASLFDTDEEGEKEDDMLRDAFEDFETLADQRKRDRTLVDKLYDRTRDGERQQQQQRHQPPQSREGSDDDDNSPLPNTRPGGVRYGRKKEPKMTQRGPYSRPGILNDPFSLGMRRGQLRQHGDSLFEDPFNLNSRKRKSKSKKPFSPKGPSGNTKYREMAYKFGQKNKTKNIHDMVRIKDGFERQLSALSSTSKEAHNGGGFQDLPRHNKGKYTIGNPKHKTGKKVDRNRGKNKDPVRLKSKGTFLPPSNSLLKPELAGTKEHHNAPSHLPTKDSTTPFSSNIDTEALEKMVEEVNEAKRRGDNATLAANIVDKAKDRIDLNATERESWKILLHGRREVIIAGVVLVVIGLVISGMAIGGIVVRYSSLLKRGEANKNNSKSYRRLGSRDEKKRLTHISLFPESSDDDSEEADELFTLPPPLTDGKPGRSHR